MMKKTLSVLLSLAIVIGAAACIDFSVFAKTTSDGFAYTVSGSSVTITGYEGTKKALVVPAKIESKNVTAIGDRAFSEKTYTSVKLPNTIKSIGAYSFSYNDALTSIVVPNSVTEIGEFAFYGDEILASVTLSENLKSIGSEAFGFCRAIKSLTIPKNVKAINDIFYFNDSLAELKILGKNTQCPNWYIGKYTSSGSMDKNIKIYAYSGSKAEAYAKKYDYPFVALKDYGKISLSKTTFTYNGKNQKPAVTIKDKSGKKLVKGTDYSITYPSSSKNVGQYTVTIQFKGAYVGKVTKSFKIAPKTTSISKLTSGKKKLTVKWKKQSTQTTGYEIQYSTDKNFKKNKKTVTVAKNKTTSKTISKLQAKKKYYVRVRTYKTVKVNGKNTKIYSSWSKAKSVVTKK